MDEEKSTETNVKVSSSGNVIVFPDFEKLKSEVEKMRTELSMLLLERDELQFVICKNIETEYMSCFFPLQRIGVAEVRLYGGLMQHAALLMTNYRWMSKLSLKNTKASLESLV